MDFLALSCSVGLKVFSVLLTSTATYSNLNSATHCSLKSPHISDYFPNDFVFKNFQTILYFKMIIYFLTAFLNFFSQETNQQRPCNQSICKHLPRMHLIFLLRRIGLTRYNMMMWKPLMSILRPTKKSKKWHPRGEIGT